MKNELITKDNIFIKGEDGNMIVSPEAIKSIREVELGMKAFEKTFEKYRKALLEGMREYGIKKVDTDEVLITYVAPTERIGLDSKKLWAEHKDIAFKCQKFTEVKDTVKITVR